MGDSNPSPTALFALFALFNPNPNAAGESYIDGAQYHWMEPFAINTTSYAVHAWDDANWYNTAALYRTVNPNPNARQGWRACPDGAQHS